MIVRFWGVRGSIPVPGPETVGIGGNTACVSVEGGDTVIVLDAGTGIKRLGESLVGGDARLVLILTHPHWDHLMGMPFFGPLYEKDRPIDVIPFQTAGTSHSPLTPVDGIHFPLTQEQLPARCTTADGDGLAMLRARGFEAGRLELNHPGGAYGYRFTYGDASLVYMTDNEIDPPSGGATSFDELVDFCRSADVLCHDAQYVEGEHYERWGWGHSALPHVCDLAVAAKVKHLVLFHHDPDRTDDQIRAMEKEARTLLDPRGIHCTAAYEGLRLDL
jgi:phosphoribosyl 1,2-cyclic phosphodiesterase